MRLRISPRSTALASALSVLLLSSCALAGTPKWVRKGRVDCTLAPCPGVYSAVGHVKGVKNAQLRRSTADANARAELAKVISRKLKKAPSKEFQSLVIESTVGVEIVDRWVSKKGVEYALATLSPESFRMALFGK